MKKKIDLNVYQPGKKITWQALSSASKRQEVPCQFCGRLGDKLLGTYFIIDSLGAKDVKIISLYPEEEEVQFPFNACFHVKQELKQEAQKQEALRSLAVYDLTDLVVYHLVQL
jgi:hypothetical protein